MILVEVIFTSERYNRAEEGTQKGKTRKVYVQGEIKLRFWNLEDTIRKIYKRNTQHHERHRED